MSENPKLIAMRVAALALVDEPWDWINKITTDAERSFTRHANPKRTLALLDVQAAAREHQCVPTGDVQNEGGDRSCEICDALSRLDAVK